MARREMGALRDFMRSTAGRLAGLAGGVTVAGEMMRSAKMDQSLARVGIAADLSLTQVSSLRSELLKLGRESGESISDLEEAASSLFAQGLGYDSVTNAIASINKTLPMTTASANSLSDALGVTSTAFGFDLSEAGKAQELLDKMAMAGNQASAELHDLAPLVSRVGVNAKAGGFGFEQMLGFLEGLSEIEKNPERLGTLADSTLRLFTNAKYLKDAQKSTGVKFFDTDGSRRDPLIVLGEIKKRMDRMRTDAQREAFLSKAFGNTDLDTIKGLRTLLSGDMLTKVGTYTSNIGNGIGTVEKSLPRALDNAVSQSGRLKNTLISAADGFAQKLNAGITGGIQKLIDSKEQGGLGLSGEQLMYGSAGGLAAAYVGGRMLKGAAGKLLGGTAGLAGGVAMGQALEKAGAAMPVFVVGAAPGVFSGGGVGGIGAAGGGAAGGAALGGAKKWLARGLLAGGSSVGSLAGAGATGAATVAGGVTLAAAGGALVGTAAQKAATSNRYTRPLFEMSTRPQNEVIMRVLAALGNKDAKGIMADRARQQKMDATINVRVTDTRTTATVGQVNFTGGPVAVRSSSGPPVGVMMREGRR